MDSDLPRLDMDAALYRAAETGDMQYIQNQSRDSSIQCKATSQNLNALHIAANFKRTEFAKVLVHSFPVLLTRADSKGNTPLHIASRTGCTEMVACLLGTQKAKEVVEARNKMGDTALHVALRNGHSEVVELLLKESSELLNLVNKHQESPLYLAVERGFFEIANSILQNYGSSCSCEGTKSMTALHAAVIRSHTGPELGKPIAELSVNGLIGLHLQAWFPGTQPNLGTDVPELSLEHLRRLVTKGFFWLREYFKLGKQKDDITEIVGLLFEKKKDEIKRADEFGWTPLHYAAHLGHREATEKLLQYDKSVAGLLDVDKSSALHIAAKNGHTVVMEKIITCLPDVYNLTDNKGRTVLHVAAQFGKARVVKYILKKPNLESIINEPDHDGNTPLHLAAMYGHYGVVIMLARDKRVDKRAMNNEYLKTIDIVQSNMDIGEIIKYWIMRKLEHAGGRQSLHRIVIRENNIQNGDSEGYQENASMQNNGHQNCSDIYRSSSNTSTQSSDIYRSSSNTSTQSSDNGSNTASKNVLVDRNKKVMKEKELRSHRLKDISNTHLLVATLIATVTFAAAFTLPGGYTNDGPNEGKAVFSTNLAFKAFLLSDGIAFYCSTAAVFLHFFASLEQNYHLLLRFIKFSAILTYVSILAMVIAFTSGIYLVLPNSSGLSTTAFVLGCLFLFFYIFGVL